MTPKTIALHGSGTNIGSIQTDGIITKLGHGKPMKDKEADASHENLSGT